MDGNTDLMCQIDIIVFHSLFDPVEHKTDKAVFIKIGNKAPILGVDGPVLKIHGSSTANAVRNAIIKSVPYSKENVVEIIRQSMLELEEVIEKDEEEYSINE